MKNYIFIFIFIFLLPNNSEAKKIEYIDYLCVDTERSPSHIGKWFGNGGSFTIKKDQYDISMLGLGGSINKILSTEYNYIGIHKVKSVTTTYSFNTILEKGSVKKIFNPSNHGTSGIIYFSCRKK